MPRRSSRTSNRWRRSRLTRRSFPRNRPRISIKTKHCSKISMAPPSARTTQSQRGERKLSEKALWTAAWASSSSRKLDPRSSPTSTISHTSRTRRSSQSMPQTKALWHATTSSVSIRTALRSKIPGQLCQAPKCSVLIRLQYHQLDHQRRWRQEAWRVPKTRIQRQERRSPSCRLTNLWTRACSTRSISSSRRIATRRRSMPSCLASCNKTTVSFAKSCLAWIVWLSKTKFRKLPNSRASARHGRVLWTRWAVWRPMTRREPLGEATLISKDFLPSSRSKRIAFSERLSHLNRPWRQMTRRFSTTTLSLSRETSSWRLWRLKMHKCEIKSMKCSSRWRANG